METNVFTKYFDIKMICVNGMIAALYAVITIACGPLSYEFSQFRISELLNLLVFFNPSYTIGLTLGCLLANLASTVGPLDIIFGTLTTCSVCWVSCFWYCRTMWIAAKATPETKRMPIKEAAIFNQLRPEGLGQCLS